MKKNEYGHFNVETCDGKKYKKTKTVYQKSKHEYILELIDDNYNVWYMIVLCGGFTKGPYKSRHHAIKILKDMPSYYNLHDLITNYYVECCPFDRAYRDVVRIIVREYGCLDSYSLYLINEVFSYVYNDEMRWYNVWNKCNKN